MPAADFRPMIALVTDSTSDLPPEVVEQAGIRVIPTLVNIGEQSFRDSIDLSRSAFYDQLPLMAVPPKTAAPAPGAFLEAYEGALTHSSHVVSVHAAGRLSGIYNAARLAAQQIAPDRITVLDSQQLSMGLGWSVIAGAETASRGESIEAVLHSITDTLSRVRLYALLNTLEYLARSGRVNMVQLGLGSLLKVKPLVELHHGMVSTVARIRTWTRAVAELADRSRQLAPVERLAVMHTHHADGAERFLRQIWPHMRCTTTPLIVQATTVIGAHIGPHALGIAVVTKK